MSSNPNRQNNSDQGLPMQFPGNLSLSCGHNRNNGQTANARRRMTGVPSIPTANLLRRHQLTDQIGQDTIFSQRFAEAQAYRSQGYPAQIGQQNRIQQFAQARIQAYRAYRSQGYPTSIHLGQQSLSHRFAEARSQAYRPRRYPPIHLGQAYHGANVNGPVPNPGNPWSLPPAFQFGRTAASANGLSVRYPASLSQAVPPNNQGYMNAQLRASTHGLGNNIQNQPSSTIINLNIQSEFPLQRGININLNFFDNRESMLQGGNSINISPFDGREIHSQWGNGNSDASFNFHTPPANVLYASEGLTNAQINETGLQQLFQACYGPTNFAHGNDATSCVISGWSDGNSSEAVNQRLVASPSPGRGPEEAAEEREAKRRKAE